MRINLLPVWYRFRESLKKFRRIDLVAFAVSLDRDGVEFGFGDNSDLSVKVDAKMEFEFVKRLSKTRATWTLGPWSSRPAKNRLWSKWSVIKVLLIRVVTTRWRISLYTYSPVMTTSGDWTQIFGIFVVFEFLLFSDLILGLALLLFPPFTILFLMICIFIIRHTFKLSTLLSTFFSVTCSGLSRD